MTESRPTAHDTSAPSRIPVKTGETQSPSPTKKPLITGASPKSSPINSQQGTPTKRKLPTPGGVGQVVKESPVQKEDSRTQAMPRGITEDQDSEVFGILTVYSRQ